MMTFFNANYVVTEQTMSTISVVLRALHPIPWLGPCRRVVRSAFLLAFCILAVGCCRSGCFLSSFSSASFSILVGSINLLSTPLAGTAPPGSPFAVSRARFPWLGDSDVDGGIPGSYPP